MVVLIQPEISEQLGTMGIVLVLIVQYILLVLFTRLGLNLGGKRELEMAAKNE